MRGAMLLQQPLKVIERHLSLSQCRAECANGNRWRRVFDDYGERAGATDASQLDVAASLTDFIEASFV